MQEKTTIDFTREALLNNFWDFVRQTVESFPDKPFIKTKQGALTFWENNNQANIIAEQLMPHVQEEGFGVGLFMKDPLKIVPSMVGVMKAGLYIVPLDVSFPEIALHQMFEVSNIRIILTDNRYFKTAQSIIKEDIVLLNLSELDMTRKVEDSQINYQPGDIVQILFTSGSTGVPKGAVEDYRYLVRAINTRVVTKTYDPQDVSLQVSTFTYSAPHTHVFSALIIGTTLYYHNIHEEGLADLPKVIRHEGITVFPMTPTVFRSFISTIKPDEFFSGVQKVRLGAEKKLLQDLQAVRRHFPNCTTIHLAYASTETHVVATTEYPIDTQFKDGSIPAGHPRDDIEILIWDEDGNQLPDGEEGEIVIHGDCLVRGYINNSELTAEKFLPDPDNPLGQYFKSGDLGKILPDGDLLHLGRIDSMVKIKGVRVELANLESHILDYPGITQVASKAVDDAQGGQKLVSYFVAEEGYEVPISDLRTHLAERLPAHQLPHFLIQLEQIPLTQSGKTDFKNLPEPKMVRPPLANPYEPPGDELEETLLQIWEEQLGISGIGVTDDFFDVGGDSLLGVVLVVAIEEKLGKGWPVSILLQAPTIRDQANMIRNEGSGNTFSVVIPVNIKGSLPPLFFIPGRGGYPTRIRHLAKYLDKEIPVYAMQDLIGDDENLPNSRQVKSTAALYLGEIRRIDSHGPYVLVGESLGGKVCYEIAQQIIAQGEPEPLIIMLDTYNFDYSVSQIYRQEKNLPYYKMLIEKHFNIWVKSDWAGKKEYLRFYRETIGEKIRKYFGRRINGGQKEGSAQIDSLLPENVRQIERENKEAIRRYVVEPYPGRVALVKAMRGPYAFDKTNGWDKVDLGKLIVHQLDCYHGSILFEPAVTHLAEIIQKYIRDSYRDISIIRFENISKKYAKFTDREVAALDHISFEIKENEFVSIVGPSGCGKTTFLKIVAKLIKADTGKIIYEGYHNPSANLVFQDQGVLPWMTVLDNVGLGLELRGIPKKERRRQAQEFMKIVRLDGFGSYYPHELSGGMRQRVALARAFLSNPNLLLMDEPFGALDAQTRIVLQEELLDIWGDYPKTVLFVTHDIDEAVLLSDRVIVMSERPGRIQAAIDIPIPRPRDLTQKDDPKFLEIRWKIWKLLEKEVREDIKIVQETH